MTRTNELKKLITGMLSECSNLIDVKIYHEIADPDAMYPHIVYCLDNVNNDDMHRNDYMLVVDVYDRRRSTERVDELADYTEEMFNNNNNPTNLILPTFFLVNRRSIKDEDKMIRHQQLQILIQNYEVE